MRRPRLQAAAAQFLLGIAGLAVITFVCFWLGVGLARTAFAYVDSHRAGIAAGQL